jgi:hypothetical protein
MIGDGAFVPISSIDSLPGIGTVKLNIPFQYENEEPMFISPGDPKGVLSAHFYEEAESSLEYSIALWTRWL